MAFTFRELKPDSIVITMCPCKKIPKVFSENLGSYRFIISTVILD